jgi:hypothetical protein
MPDGKSTPTESVAKAVESLQTSLGELASSVGVIKAVLHAAGQTKARASEP